MLQLHITNKNYSSWSLRPWVLLRERGLPFEERLAPLSAASAQGAFRAFSPSGRVPCLVDGDVTVWDSLAIVEYLAERDPGVWPEAAPARAWARSAAAEMHSGFGALRSRCGMNCGLRVRLREVPDDLRRDLGRLDELWQDGLGRWGGPFLAGPRFTAVDAFFAPVAFRIQTYGLEPGAASLSYAARLLALPSMHAWYEAAIAEPWREEVHEQETVEAGVVLEDHRVRPA